MVTTVLLHVPTIYHAKVSLESVHESAPGLTDTLDLARLASDAVNQVGALACDILPSQVCSASTCTHQFTRGVQKCTISAILCRVAIEGLTAGLCPYLVISLSLSLS